MSGPGSVPESFVVRVHTTAGAFDVAVQRPWAPYGADRFHQLVTQGYYDDSRFFRVIAGKWAQFGIAGVPAVAQAWRGRTIPDDRPVQSNRLGFVAFANTGPGTRATQVYVNLRDNAAQLDPEPAFAPFGQVLAGLDVVMALNAEYGETSGGGLRGGKQDWLFAGGNQVLDQRFPRLDKLIRAEIP